MDWYLELCLRALEAHWRGWFDERVRQALRRCQDHRSWHGVDRVQRENRRVIVLDGCLVLTMVLEQAVRRHVAMYHELGMPMVVALVHVLRRSYRQ